MHTLSPSRPVRRGSKAAPGAARPPPRDSLSLDYQWTNEQIKLLTDIRFRLLVLVPPIVTIGVTLLASQTFGAASPLAMIGIGLLGLGVTLGIVLYDLRNSQLYDALVHRAALIERKMRMASLINGPDHAWGGPHALRLRGFGRLFWIFRVSHGSSLSLIYGVLLSAWIYPISKGFLILLGLSIKASDWIHPSLWVENSGATTTAFALLITGIAAILFIGVLRCMDQPGLAEKIIYNDRNHPVSAEKLNEGPKQFVAEEFKSTWAKRFVKAGLIRE